MTQNEIIQTLKTIEEKMFSLPFDAHEERQEIFDQSYKQLEQLLEIVNTLNPQEKKTIMPTIQDFSKRIRNALKSIEEKIKNFEQGVHATRSHSQGIKAYMSNKLAK